MPNLSGIRGCDVAAKTLELVRAEIAELKAAVGDDQDTASTGLLEVGPSVEAALVKMAIAPVVDQEALHQAHGYLGSLYAVNACLRGKNEILEAYAASQRGPARAAAGNPTPD